jgi:hypothetical protein
MPPDRHAGDEQAVAQAVVGLHQHAERVRGLTASDHARGGADAALELVADHAGAAADVALRDRAARGSVERRIHVCGLDVKAVDVVEMAVPGLGDDRQRPPVAGRVGGALAHAPGDHGVAHHADAVRVGQEHRPLQLPRLLDPGGAGHLAVAVQCEPSAEYRRAQAIAAARQDRGDARAHLVPARQVLDQRGVANRHAGDVRDRIERSRLAVERHAEVPRAQVGRKRGRRRRQQDENGSQNAAHGVSSVQPSIRAGAIMAPCRNVALRAASARGTPWHPSAWHASSPQPPGSAR